MYGLKQIFNQESRHINGGKKTKKHNQKVKKKMKSPRNATQTCPSKEEENKEKEGGTQYDKTRRKKKNRKNREKTPAGLDISSDNNKSKISQTTR
jgi:hypothetical protein